MLYPDKITKMTGGNLLAFPYPTLTDEITNATKIFVGADIYVLEPSKKRLVIVTKNGVLQKQIYLPNVTTLLDFQVDEAGRILYFLDDNKLYKIIF